MSTFMITFGSFMAYTRREGVCTHKGEKFEKIPSSGNFCFKVFTNRLIVIKNMLAVVQRRSRSNVLKLILHK